MFQDEARFGLIRSLRPCWAQKPIRPELPHRIARHYTYVYGAVSPLDGKSDFLILPSMRKEAFDYFLKELSRRYPQEHIALIVDGAASHRSEKVDVPDNITLIGLPPYSPQLNPIVPSEATSSKLVESHARTLLPKSRLRLHAQTRTKPL